MLRTGATPDQEVNRLHFELQNLSVRKIAQLARFMSSSEPVPISRMQVRANLGESLSMGTLDLGRLERSLLRDIHRSLEFRELDRVALTVDNSENGLEEGDVGTVLLVHDTNEYDVEFQTLDGVTLTRVLLSSTQST